MSLFIKCTEFIYCHKVKEKKDKDDNIISNLHIGLFLSCGLLVVECLYI